MRQLKDITVALLPIGNNEFTMDIEDAVNATLAISPKIVIPMHILDEDPYEFKEKAESKSVIKVAPLTSISMNFRRISLTCCSLYKTTISRYIEPP